MAAKWLWQLHTSSILRLSIYSIAVSIVNTEWIRQCYAVILAYSGLGKDFSSLHKALLVKHHQLTRYTGTSILLYNRVIRWICTFIKCQLQVSVIWWLKNYSLADDYWVRSQTWRISLAEALAISTSIMILVKWVISTSILKSNNPKGPNMAELYGSIPIENDCP